MNQTIFDEDELTMLREMVFETAMQDWCVAWQAKDSSALDQLAIWSSRMAGPDRDSAEVESIVIHVYGSMQNRMIEDLKRRGSVAPARLIEDLTAIAARCTLALAQLEKAAQNARSH